MKIALIGAGLTGLTASYYLSEKHQVIIFEKSSFLGGLASGFKAKNWDWSLEYAYHHLFANDYEIINFSKEIGFNNIFFSSPETASLFNISNSKFQIHRLDTPLNLLSFPYLSFFEKIRSGLTLAFLKFSPFFSFYEKQTSSDFLIKFMGKKAYQILFQELFRKKFGKYAENILASFIWARIKKRTKNLGYFQGGFQAFIDFLACKLKEKGVKILTNYEIKEIKKEKEKFLIDNQIFDVVISTLSSPLTAQIGKKIFPADFTQNLRKINYLGAITLILESKMPLLKKNYWLNISTSKIPIMGIINHTNFIDKKYYQGNHLVYLAWYLKKNDKKLKMTKEELLKYVKPYLEKINPEYYQSIVNSYIFKNLYAQPIFDKQFLKYKPKFLTPVKNFFIANLEMTYPYDRGTNYAVKLGKEIAVNLS
ncbi:MAG: FAD-dependent oxidoreductase [Patescibacteria group bacterium]|nr:FAD-dependent oxidoreductase [Patescibacteria group bacterium]